LYKSCRFWRIFRLFYELLTGNFFFEEIQDNYLDVRIDKSSINELLTEKKLNLLDNNPYLVDFLRFIFAKIQIYRPNMEIVIK
jgi:hypothetical protein